MRKKAKKALFALCVAAACGTACNSHKGANWLKASKSSVDIARVLSWLPADTETITVAIGPFWMSNFQTGQDLGQNREVSVEELEKQFELLPLLQFDFSQGVLEKRLEGQSVFLAVEGSRRFRSPAGLGELLYEGCAIAVFADGLGNRGESFLKDSAKAMVRMEEMEGQRVGVFQEKKEEDLWTLFVAFPQSRVVLVATNRDYLREVLARMRGATGERALPDTLPEWRYVNRKGKFWGLRHFDKKQAEEDPTSPFGGQKSANLPDEQAIGLTFGCDPSKARTATITYLSAAKDMLPVIKEKLFPFLSEPEGTKGLHIRYRELEPGVIQGLYDLDHSEPVNWFLFVLMGNLGHAIFV